MFLLDAGRSRHHDFRIACACAASVVMLVACGGGSSSPAGESATVQLSGVVVDGPIQGATVFLDLNDNRQHDSGEPLSLPTDAQGAFTIVAQRLTRAQAATSMLVAQVPDTARDADDAGATLAGAGRRSFTLLTPAGAFVDVSDSGANVATPVVVSPLTTLVAGEMAHGLSLAQAKAAVQSRLGAVADPMGDFVAAGDAGLGRIARTVAIALGEAGRSIAETAQQQGGIAVRDQVAATIDAVRAQLPALLAELGASGTGLVPAGVVVDALAQPQPVAALSAAAADMRRSAGEFHHYVVVFRDNVGSPAARATEVMRGRGGQIRHTYEHAIKGFAVTLPDSAADAFLLAMQNNPNVDHVEVDKPVSIAQTTQSNPTWGLDRADQRDLPLSGSYTYGATGTGVRAYVVDTGIQAGHVDFGGRVAGGYTAINDGYGTNDCNGHGTHVAGTVGGATWGIAKGVSLVPVRVLDCSGSGSLSGVIAGIDWVVANALRPAIINMSLGGGASSTLDAAVANAVAKGIPVVVAAGNSSANACNYSPAREPSAITVAASTSSDARASYSNYGTCVDLFAPGSSVKSAWYTSTTSTATLSGTSMAAPHVAGLAAQLLEGSPAATPSQVADAIKSAATTGKVTSAGSGSPNLLLYASAGTGSSEPPPPSATITVSVASLGGSSALVRNGWRATATIAVKDANGTAVGGAVVSGGFSVGGSSVNCTTGSNGACSVSSGNIHKSTTETRYGVSGITGTGMSYDANANVATSIVIRKP